MTNFSENVTAIVLLLNALIAAYGVIVSRRNRADLKVVKTTVKKVEEQTNGLNEKLVAAEKVISKAEGKVEERSEVADRNEKKESARINVAPADVRVVNTPAERIPTTNKP